MVKGVYFFNMPLNGKSIASDKIDLLHKLGLGLYLLTFWGEGRDLSIFISQRQVKALSVLPFERIL